MLQATAYSNQVKAPGIIFTDRQLIKVSSPWPLLTVRALIIFLCVLVPFTTICLCPGKLGKQEDSDSDSDVSCNYEVIDRCDNSRFAKYWSLIGSKFLDTADNINFNITAVCKCDGTYYFRYVREHVKHAKMSDFEYTPVSELLNADWYSPIDNSTDDGDNEAPRQSKKTRKC